MNTIPLTKRVSTLLDNNVTTPFGTNQLKSYQIVSLHTIASNEPIHLSPMGKFVLGRENMDDNGIDLTSIGGAAHGVSRRHATLTMQHYRVLLTDLGSRNGTYLNAQKLTPNEPVAVSHGDEIRLGNMVMFVYFVKQQ